MRQQRKHRSHSTISEDNTPTSQHTVIFNSCTPPCDLEAACNQRLCAFPQLKHFSSIQTLQFQLQHLFSGSVIDIGVRLPRISSINSPTFATF